MERWDVSATDLSNDGGRKGVFDEGVMKRSKWHARRAVLWRPVDPREHPTLVPRGGSTSEVGWMCCVLLRCRTVFWESFFSFPKPSVPRQAFEGHIDIAAVIPWTLSSTSYSSTSCTTSDTKT